MIDLEKLYETAGVNLEQGTQDWEKFAAKFQQIFDADIALYKPAISTEVMDLRSAEEIISSSNHEMVRQYFKDKIYENNDLLKDPEIPFEPIRRSDSLSDKEMKELPIWPTFLQPHGIYHIIVVYAVLADGSFLMNFVWRNDEKPDFSDIEKQRLALFMRHLAAIVGNSIAVPVQSPNESIVGFGEKYGLTNSEISILSALIQGASLRSIASKSDRSYGTVRWHVHNILEKCQVKTQQSLMSEFYRLIKR